MNILVVDDDMLIRTLVKELLEPDGHKVFRAGSGLDAINLATELAVDLILMDQYMPEMDGITTCHHLKKIPATRDIPVVMISSESRMKFIEKAFEEGVENHIQKPIDITSFAETLYRKLSLHHDDLDLAYCLG